MPRWTRDLSPIDHPAVVRQPFSIPGKGIKATITMATIKCPRCDAPRDRPACEVRRESKRPTFRGYCRVCAIAAVADGSHRWNTFQRKPRSEAPHIGGYAFTPVRDVPDELLPMYRAMQKSQQPVMEHRWVMANHLGRALTSHELVDHMDGNKTNNCISNLRLYTKGKQQPGSTNGYGTYYHEWQMAEAKIVELQAKLDSLENRAVGAAKTDIAA